MDASYLQNGSKEDIM